MRTRVAVIGTGPTGIYTLADLVRHDMPLDIVLFEKSETAGVGMPFSPEVSNKTMLANIASIEIPEIGMSYLDWLKTLSGAKLRQYGLDQDDLDERSFTPRLLLGEYFREQFLWLLASGREAGHLIEVLEATEITDIGEWNGELFLSTSAGRVERSFDRVVLATGHAFPEDDGVSGSYYPNPWSGMIRSDIPAARVGIIGTSLSGIDAAMAVATKHGHFRRGVEGSLIYDCDDPDLQITMISRKGLLPEADFYCAIPYEELRFMTEKALEACRRSSRPLDAVFDLFRAEITEADPGYASRIGLDRLNADDFADAYFAVRAKEDPFRWARKNLQEAERNKAHKITVPWRYAILRMHERVEEIIPDLPEDDYARFDAGMKQVFIDNYAAVPPESIRRLLALRDAGVLKVEALGDDYDLRIGHRASKVKAGHTIHEFDVLIDARGQKPMTSADLPFPSLRHLLLAADQDNPDVAWDYTLVSPPEVAGRISLGAIPYLMHDRPFVQGIAASAEIGTNIARGIRENDTSKRLRLRRRWA